MDLAELTAAYRREWFSTAGVARLVGRSEYSVREWCRLGRLRARKRPCGRGAYKAWEIHADELARFINHGLLPSPNSAKSS